MSSYFKDLGGSKVSEKVEFAIEPKNQFQPIFCLVVVTINEKLGIFE